jgi:hypothetical protein
MPFDPSGRPAELVRLADRARAATGRDATIVAALQLASDGAWLYPVGEAHDDGAELPPLEGIPAAGTARLEARALDTRAGAILRTLVAATGAQHLERVEEWPAAAVAIGDTLYVNAAWLVALAPPDAVAVPSPRATTSAPQPPAPPSLSENAAPSADPVPPPPSTSPVWNGYGDPGSCSSCTGGPPDRSGCNTGCYPGGGSHPSTSTLLWLLLPLLQLGAAWRRR